MDINKLNANELTVGYYQSNDCYICSYCEKKFKNGQVYPMNHEFFMAEDAVKKHIETEHGGNFKMLIENESRYNTLTEHQKELMGLFRQGFTDNEIAEKLSISPSTVRKQKFTFREKAKQAKLYLAVYEHVFGSQMPENGSVDDIIAVHESARYVDDRYLITKEESQQIIERFFSSLSPLKLKLFSPKEKNKVVILMKISEEFDMEKRYSEKEINEVLKNIYSDYAEIRRYLIMYGYMDRTKDGRVYWRCK